MFINCPPVKRKKLEFYVNIFRAYAPGTFGIIYKKPAVKKFLPQNVREEFL
jgi:hypothetical protein